MTLTLMKTPLHLNHARLYSSIETRNEIRAMETYMRDISHLEGEAYETALKMKEKLRRQYGLPMENLTTTPQYKFANDKLYQNLSLTVCNKELTKRSGRPLLVISFSPLPHKNFGTIMNTDLTLRCIQIKLNVVHHSYCVKTMTQILALSPKNRLVNPIWVVFRQLDLQNKHPNEFSNKNKIEGVRRCYLKQFEVQIQI
ncbi:hypothetical protein LXL04_004729 [Taraxacum kok-saghyz]